MRIPVAQISPALAATLVRSSGRSFDDLSKSAETARGLTPVAIPGPQIDLAVSVDRHIMPEQNVVAAIEGADGRLKDEWVILCAHFDHWPFLQHEVPAIGFATGLHPDYHTVYDRPEKINYEKLTKIARLVHQASWDLATQDTRPTMGAKKTSPVSREF